MADYSAFSPEIRPWLQKVWKEKGQIEQVVRTYDKKRGLQAGRAEGAGQVYDRYNDPAVNKQETLEFREFMGDAIGLSDSYNIVLAPQGGEWAPHNFYHFGENPRAGKGLWRVYAHVKSPRSKNWMPTAEYCLTLMRKGEERDVEKFKVAGPGMSDNRGDQIVIWVNSEAAKDSMLKQLQTFSNFDGNPPPGIKQISPGLGWGKEPTAQDNASPAVDEVSGTSNHSFGSYLSGVIYMALEQSWKKTEDSYVEELTEFFLNVGIDPAKPHLLRTISWDELKQMAGVTNAKVVTSGIGKQTTVFTDKTSPFPL